MLSLDILNMFGSIPPEPAVNLVTEQFYNKFPNFKIEAAKFRTLLLCALFQFFVFDKKYYKQILGLAMGSPLSPILASIYVFNIERKFLYTFRFNIMFYRRFIDDTFLLWKGTETKLKTL